MFEYESNDLPFISFFENVDIFMMAFPAGIQMKVFIDASWRKICLKW